MTADRAIVFDLDDTLYRVRRYSLSAFRAVANALGDRGFEPAVVFTTLQAAYRRGAGSRAFQVLEARIGHDHGVDLLDVYRSHRPSLRLAPESRRVLAALRPSWRVGVLTNGPPDQQRRKVDALDLVPHVDAIVYAHECSDTGKPDALAFHAVLRALGASAARTVMVGDDPKRDIVGARASGCATIRVLRPHRLVCPDDEADAVVASLDDVPIVAERLILERHGPDM